VVVCGETDINPIAVTSPVGTQLCVKQILCLLYTGDDGYGQVILNTRKRIKKVNQSHYRLEVPKGFQEVKVPRLRDNGPEWW